MSVRRCRTPEVLQRPHTSSFTVGYTPESDIIKTAINVAYALSALLSVSVFLAKRKLPLHVTQCMLKGQVTPLWPTASVAGRYLQPTR